MEARSHFTHVKHTGRGSRTTPASSGINKVLLRKLRKPRPPHASQWESAAQEETSGNGHNAAAAFKHRYIYLLIQ